MESLVLGLLGGGAGLVLARWTMAGMTRVLGMTQPKISSLLCGRFRGISEAKMLDCLVRLGHDVQIVIGPARQTPNAGRVEVVFA